MCLFIEMRPHLCHERDHGVAYLACGLSFVKESVVMPQCLAVFAKLAIGLSEIVVEDRDWIDESTCIFAGHGIVEQALMVWPGDTGKVVLAVSRGGAECCAAPPAPTRGIRILPACHRRGARRGWRARGGTARAGSAPGRRGTPRAAPRCGCIRRTSRSAAPGRGGRARR